MGRAWFFYWLVPYPPEMRVWPQFRSALTWDVAAVSTYLTVSFLFWYMGLVPDLAAMRDRAPELWRRRVYGVFALGWHGSAKNWSHYRIAYGLLGGLATPLVVSVHSVVSMDFAIAQLPGWHSTIFPPYFVAGAIYSGFAMVLTLLIPIRHAFKLHHVITKNHLDNIAKMLLVTGWIVTYAYIVEPFVAYYSGDRYERYAHLVMQPFGPFAWLYWLLLFCNCVSVQVLWSKRARTSVPLLFALSLVINAGMWLERFVLIVTAQSHDFLPSSWRTYTPSIVDATIIFGTLFFFTFLFLLFLRWVPFIPISELKELRKELVEEEREHERELERGGPLGERAPG
jgi:molybdopterin-containing oxidoreductase family membrane subunit